MEIQLHLRKKEEDKAIKSDCNVSKVKLTFVISIYLVVTKLNGTHIDWVRFGNQFESETDRSELSAASRFSYLQELF